MRKILAILVLLAFVLIVQMSFVHAIDMGMEHDAMLMNISHSVGEHDGALCNDTTNSSAQSCFTEISESKWIKNVQEFKLGFLIIASLFFYIGISVFPITSRSIQASFCPRIFYHPTLYLGLYGIIRNVN